MPVAREQRELGFLCQRRNPDVVFGDGCAGPRQAGLDPSVVVGGLFVREQEDAAPKELADLGEGLGGLLRPVSAIVELAQNQPRASKDLPPG